MGNNSFVIWFPLVFAIGFAGIGFLVAFTRRGRVSSARFDYKAIKIHSPGTPDTVFARVRELAGMHPKYKLDDEDPTRLILVFSSSPSLFSWGFFYPVVVTPVAGGGSQVQVDIQSRFFQWGPVVSHNRQNCANAIEKLLSVPGAQVVSR